MLPDRDLAADLQSVRLQAGLSVRELVRSCRIPRSTIADALSGRRFPRLETVLAIVRACGADPDPWRRRWVVASREQSLRGEAAASDASLVPAQLPRDVPGFASRGPELARLNQAGVALVHGRPGVGKTALAVHWARSAAHSYPDGQLFVNLRGHHPTLAPMAAVEALGRLLGSLGLRWVPVTDAPDEGASVWRSAVAGRRLLIVLDDAVHSDQVRPLLPGTPGCAVVVSSRHYLSDLLVRGGADGVVLDVLPPDSSLALLGQVAGAERVRAEPAAAAAVVAACGHLPLAVRLAGAVVAGAPQRRFADLVAELTAGDRLTALEELARPSEVESAFELSYRTLVEDARLLFRRLGLHPGPEIGVQVAALLVDLDADAAGRSLRMLAEAHLVEPAGPGRYRMHDLLRDYAARLVDSIDGPRQRDAARRRLFDWYVDRALAVSSRLDKGRERLLTHGLNPTWEPDDDEASAWLSAEHGNVIAVIEDDAHRGTGWYVWALVDVMAVVMSRRRDMAGLITATDAGLASARRQGDLHAEGVLCVQRGWLRWRGRQTEGAAADSITHVRCFATQGYGAARRRRCAGCRYAGRTRPGSTRRAGMPRRPWRSTVPRPTRPARRRHSPASRSSPTVRRTSRPPRRTWRRRSRCTATGTIAATSPWRWPTWRARVSSVGTSRGPSRTPRRRYRSPGRWVTVPATQWVW